MMPEGELPERPQRTLTTEQQDEAKAAFWEEFHKRASYAPSGEDPAYWPIHILDEVNDLIVNKAAITNQAKAALAEKLAPMKESIRKVKTAYAILAYPHCQDWGSRENIEAELETDRQAFGRDQVELNDTELKMVQKLCETPRYTPHGDREMLQPRIPFDPQKRVYAYAEVPLSPHVNPFGRRHMSTEEIRREKNRDAA